jgi:phage baseplate assembly protein W
MATPTIGIQFPLQDDLENNRLFRMDVTAQQTVKSQLLFLVLTPKGSRWYTPDFGSNLRKYLFEPNDGITWEAINQELNTAVGKYIPNLSITKLDTKDGRTPYSIILSVHYIYTEGFYRESDLLEVEFSSAK